MTYYINKETANAESVEWNTRADRVGAVGMFGMAIGALGLTGAILTRVLGIALQPAICFGIMFLGIIIMGLSGVFIGDKPLSVAFLEAAQNGKVLFVHGVPVSQHEPERMIISAMIEKPDGKVEIHELGYAKKCLHTHYKEDTIDLHNAVVYTVPYEAASK